MDSNTINLIQTAGFWAIGIAIAGAAVASCFAMLRAVYQLYSESQNRRKS